jgi:hypothetical protein
MQASTATSGGASGMRVGVGVDFQSRAAQSSAEQRRADHEGQVTKGRSQEVLAQERSCARQGKAHRSHRAADIAMAARLSVARFNFSSMRQSVQQQQQQQHRARPPRPHRGETSWQDMDAIPAPRR